MEARQPELRVLGAASEGVRATEEARSGGVRWRVASSPAPGEDRGREDPDLAGGVCVLGMHRSGTSLVAGILKELGVALGPEDEFLPPNENNQRGYRELAELVEINDQILTRFGGSWDNPPELPVGWADSKELAPLRDRATRALGARFAGSAPWAWKDPRNCVTLPFWQLLVPGLRYVVCVRNPVDVADSLRSREGEGRPWPEHVAEWLRHTALALVHTAGRPRTLVHFEHFFQDPEQRVRRLARFLGVEERLVEPATMARITELVDPELVHGYTGPDRVAEDPRVPLEAAALYMTLRLASDLEGIRAPARDLAPGAWTAINALARRCFDQFLERLEAKPRL